jgi:hypothetical protein
MGADLKYLIWVNNRRADCRGKNAVRICRWANRAIKLYDTRLFQFFLCAGRERVRKAITS